MILTDFNDEELAKYRMKIRDLACDLELENNIILAPMAGITDLPFRIICKKFRSRCCMYRNGKRKSFNVWR